MDLSRPAALTRWWRLLAASRLHDRRAHGSPGRCLRACGSRSVVSRRAAPGRRWGRGHGGGTESAGCRLAPAFLPSSPADCDHKRSRQAKDCRAGGRRGPFAQIYFECFRMPRHQASQNSLGILPCCAFVARWRPRAAALAVSITPRRAAQVRFQVVFCRHLQTTADARRQSFRNLGVRLPFLPLHHSKGIHSAVRILRQ